jgi:hypothetical protein
MLCLAGRHQGQLLIHLCWTRLLVDAGLSLLSGVAPLQL